MKFLPLVVQKLSSEWTDRQTDRQNRLKLLPIAYADGNNMKYEDIRKFSVGARYLVHSEGSINKASNSGDLIFYEFIDHYFHQLCMTPVSFDEHY